MTHFDMLHVKLNRVPTDAELADMSMLRRLEEEFGTPAQDIGKRPGVSVGAVVLTVTSLVGAAAALYSSGLLDGLFGRKKDHHDDGHAHPDTHTTHTSSHAPPPAPTHPSVNIPGREYTVTDVTPEALSKFVDLAGVKDRPGAIDELIAANPGINLSHVNPNTIIKIPPSWPDRPELYRSHADHPSIPISKATASHKPTPSAPRSPLSTLLPVAAAPVAGKAIQEGMKVVGVQLSGAPSQQLPPDGQPLDPQPKPPPDPGKHAILFGGDATWEPGAQQWLSTPQGKNKARPHRPAHPHASHPSPSPSGSGNAGNVAADIAGKAISTVGSAVSNAMGGGDGKSPLTSLLGSAASSLGDLAISGHAPEEDPDEGA